LYAASRSLQKAMISFSPAQAPTLNASTAFTSSPWLSCGMPITAASATAGCA